MGAASEIPPLVVKRDREGRKFGRIRLHMVGSNLGAISDVSSLGARIECRGFRGPNPNDRVTLEIEGLDGPIKVEARIAWVRRTGLFRHSAGVEFHEPDANARKGLVDLVRRAPMNEIFARVEGVRRSA